jgi:hypothetical protein
MRAAVAVAGLPQVKPPKEGWEVVEMVGMQVWWQPVDKTQRVPVVVVPRAVEMRDRGVRGWL